jgi:hypothetical protein
MPDRPAKFTVAQQQEAMRRAGLLSEPVYKDGRRDWGAPRPGADTTIAGNAHRGVVGSRSRLYGLLAGYGIGVMELPTGRTALLLSDELIVEVSDPLLFTPEQVRQFIRWRRHKLAGAMAEAASLATLPKRAAPTRPTEPEQTSQPSSFDAVVDVELPSAEPSFLGDETMSEVVARERRERVEEQPDAVESPRRKSDKVLGSDESFVPPFMADAKRGEVIDGRE